MPKRALTETIPEYLRAYIVEQDSSLYTPMDHASWRFIMKISRAFFAKNAHPMYLKGLEATGISSERIPLISEMDEKLRRFGWRAVAVSGFIPPAVFMEFLSRGVLPIACDMRKIENISYTPAPDIVHEAAGHAPIIAEPAYAEYLRHYGELAEKAIYSSQDLDVYNAVRELSDTKEDPNSTPDRIKSAQQALDAAAARVDHVSEATELGRMGWWTIEYGLLGENPNSAKIYGAGLLSSVGESYHCLSAEVAKIPFSVKCVETGYDITRPQPQLFVAKDFPDLVKGLDELAEKMAFRRGGLEGLEKAKKAAVTTTTVLDSGIQISGKLTRVWKAADGSPCYLQFQGPTQLSYKNNELQGQGPHYHKEGFGTALGQAQGFGRSIAEFTENEIDKLSAETLKSGLKFESGVVVQGRLKSKLKKDGKTLILSFTECTVRLGSETLFEPAWGTYDLACGSSVVSVFGGAADRSKYLAATGGFNQTPNKPKTNLTEKNKPLNLLYSKVRELREEAKPDQAAIQELAAIYSKLESEFPEDWLLRYELLELDKTHRLHSPWAKKVKTDLEKISTTALDKSEMILRGMELL